MDSSLKKKLRALSLALRHTLEGSSQQPGDLETRLNEIGIRRKRLPRPIEELPQLSEPDRAARRVVDAFLRYRQQAGISQEEAFAEFVREAAYSWANRLFTLRCMEARGLIEEVILQKPVYGGRSLVHYRFAKQNPAACAGEDDGLFAVLEEEFRRRAPELPAVFEPQARAIALRPSVSALKRCIGLLSDTVTLNGQGEAKEELFGAADTLGWAYQFWNAEEKDRVFEKVRTEKGAKIEGADLIPATQLYTEPYMVKFLVQNSLGALWAGMYPDSNLPSGWEYYVRDADRTPPVQPDPPPFGAVRPPRPSGDPWVRPNPKLRTEAEILAYARTLTAKADGAEKSGFIKLRNELLEAAAKPSLQRLVELNQQICEAWDQEWPPRRPKLHKRAAEITFLDPACGSGHFLLEASDLLYAMYEEEGLLRTPEEIGASILNHNLYGIDIDERAIQITVAALWMHALERAPKLKPEAVTGLRDHVVAANLSLPRGREHLEDFLAKHPEDADLRPALEAVFRGLADANQLGTLLRIEEPVERELRRRKEEEDRYAGKALRESQTKLEFMPEQYVLTVSETRDYEAWKQAVLERLKEHFRQEAAVADPVQGFFGREARQGLALFDLLARRYDVVAANPPYMGSRNMGAVLRAYCATHYTPGKRDLYAVFIERCRELCRKDGYVAMVTQQSWMFLRSFVDLRTSILQETAIETLAHLGAGAFAEISGEVVNIALFCVRNTCVTMTHRLAAFRLIGPKNPEGKTALLLHTLADGAAAVVSRPQQARFMEIPQSPICYWLRERFFELLAGTKLGDVADVCQGMATGNDARFVRFHWEVPLRDWGNPLRNRRWVPFEKGGGYGKWFGHHFWVVDWGHDGSRLKTITIERYGNAGKRIFNEDKFFVDGLTFSVTARGSLGVRVLQHAAFSSQGAAIVFRMPRPAAALINARVSTTLIRAMTAQMYLRESYVARVPLPTNIPESLTALESACVALKKSLVSFDLLERSFVGLGSEHALSFSAANGSAIAERDRTAAMLHTFEATAEREAFNVY